VLDPETGVDRVCGVGIDGGSITAVSDELDSATTVDARGLVVASTRRRWAHERSGARGVTVVSR
jgi:hypothetical protein